MGRLDVRLVEARNLPDIQSVGTIDPYVKIKLDLQTQTSKVIDDKTSPVWNEVFKFTVADENSCQLIVEVWNSNVASDDFLGSYSVSLSGLVKGEVRDEWYLLQRCQSNAEIHLRLLAIDFGLEPSGGCQAAPLPTESLATPPPQQTPPVVAPKTPQTASQPPLPPTGPTPGQPSPYGGAPPGQPSPYGGAPPGQPNPYGGAPPGQPSPYGGAPPGQPSPYGGAPPGQPSPYGGAPPGQPSPYGGAPPGQPSPYGGAPPGQPSPYGGAPPGQPSPYGGAPPGQPSPYGGAPPGQPNPYGGAPPGQPGAYGGAPAVYGGKAASAPPPQSSGPSRTGVSGFFNSVVSAANSAVDSVHQSVKRHS